jgi:hypothetical protein
MNFFDKDSTLICILHKLDDWNKGLDFITDDKAPVQMGTWWYDKGKCLDRHYHNKFNRTSNITGECVVVLSGSMKVDLYDNDQILINSFNMYSGDTAIFLDGGHGYFIREDNTKIIESKNGPYLGVQRDKTRF